MCAEPDDVAQILIFATSVTQGDEAVLHATRIAATKIGLGSSAGRALAVGLLICTAICLQSRQSAGAEPPVILAAATQDQAKPSDAKGKNALSPEEKMQRRFPQPVRVGDLIGLPVLDEQDSTIGYVRQVVRTPEGKIELIVPYARWLGWVRYGEVPFLRRRLVSVPLALTQMMGRQLAAIDMSREEFDGAPTWTAAQGSRISGDEIIRIAIGKR